MAAQTETGAPPSAGHICAEAHANILRARLGYVQNSMHDTLVITRIFHAGGNDYAVELCQPNQVDQQSPDVWLESFYLINKGEQTLNDPLLTYSVGDRLGVQGAVTGAATVDDGGWRLGYTECSDMEVHNMAAVTFDTLKFMETLEAAKLTREQASAIASAVRDAHDAADVATKGDLRELELKLRSELMLLKWMLGFLMGGVVALILKAFF